MSEKRNIYALFVSIDDYPIARHKLNGCVNDMKAFKGYIENRFDPDKVNLHIKTLINEEATRDNVIDGFMSHLMQAKGRNEQDKDLALFYFSGHGAQEPMPWELHKTDEKKLIQSIVCYDSRLEGGNDLVNKELGYLIHKVKTFGKGNNQPEFVVVMDCCHSGSGTRSTSDTTKSRQMDLRKKNRKIEEFLGYEERNERSNGQGQQIIDFPAGEHILLAAARSHETAKETAIDGTQRGVFTYSLVRALQDAKNDINYEDLIERTQVFAFNKVDDQLPQLELVGNVSGKNTFLGGGSVMGKDQYKVEWKDITGWYVDVGSMNGVPYDQDPSAPTTFKLFPMGTSAVEISKNEKLLGKATVIDADLVTSTLSMPDALDGDQETAYIAVVENWGSKPMMVYLEGAEEDLKPLRQVIGADNGGPAFIALTDKKANADYRVLAAKGSYAITTLADNRPVARRAKGYNVDSATNVANDLEHISRWKTGMAFSNPDTDYTTFPIKTEIFKVLKQVGGAGKVEEEVLMEGTQHELQCKYVHGAWEPCKFRIKLTNTQEEPMHVAILYFSGRFGIQYLPVQMSVSQDMHGNQTRVKTWVKEMQPGETIWAINGCALTADLDYEKYGEQGLTEASDVLKIVASTDRFDLEKFKKQAGLLPPKLDPRASLDYDEDSEFYEEDDFNFLAGDWTTQEHFVITVKPLPLVPFSWNREAELWGRVNVKPNNVVSGMASLTTAEQAARGIGRSMYPPAISENFDMEAVKFNPGWNTDKGMAVLELVEVTGLDQLSEANPLKIELTNATSNVSQVVAIGTDGKSFTYLGKTERRIISLTKLPKASNTISEKLPDSHKVAFVRIHLKDGVSYEDALQELEEGLALLG